MPSKCNAEKFTFKSPNNRTKTLIAADENIFSRYMYNTAFCTEWRHSWVSNKAAKSYDIEPKWISVTNN